MPSSSLRPRNKDAQRCGQRWSMTPTRPELSRNAINRSPSSISRIGAPSRSNSEPIAAGSQYCRIMSPMTVPGPTRTRSSLSFCLLMSTSLENGETEPGAGPGRGAVARNVMRPGQIEMLDGAADRDPHADLRAAGIQLFARQRPQGLAVLAGERVDDAAIQFLVDDKMAEPARADDADARVARIAFDRLADRPAEIIAAPWCRLVRRVVGVEEHRHDRQVLSFHQPLAHKGVGVAFAVPGHQPVRRGDVELAVDQ